MSLTVLISNWLKTVFLISSIVSVRSVPIVGGEVVPYYDQTFGFEVSLQHKKYNETTHKWEFIHFCGGILLQVFEMAGYVISAAHCLAYIDEKSLAVVIGATNLRDYQGKRFENVTVYKKTYDRYTLADDICLIKVNLGDCDYSKLNPIRVIIDETTAFNDKCYICGYGSEKVSGGATLDLRIAPVRIIPHESCVRQLGTYNAPQPNSGMFCAIGESPGIDACLGDSGSGLFCIHNRILAIVGLITYGLGCGIKDMPGAYTSVIYHADFIRESIAMDYLG